MTNEITRDEIELLIYHSSKARKITDDIIRKTNIVNNTKLINLLNDIQYGNKDNIHSIMEDIDVIMEMNKADIEIDRD